MRNKRFTLAKYLRDGSELLFDNQKDPLQTHNLVSDPFYADVYENLKSKMQKKMAALNDEFKPCSWYKDRWTDGKRNIIASAVGKF